MNIDISKGIEVGSYHYEVRQNEEAEQELESDNAFGKCDNYHRIIKVTKNSSPQQIHNTIIHEFLEAINCVNCNDKLKHEETTNLANGLAQVFQSLGVQFVYKEKEI